MRQTFVKNLLSQTFCLLGEYRVSKKILWLLVYTSIALGVACSVEVYDEDQASDEALIFAKIAFVERNTRDAYERLHEKTKESVSLNRFADLLKLMHPRGWPQSVAKKGYQIIPGRNALNIYIDGRNEDELFFYRFEVDQTKSGGYRVLSLFRGRGEYPRNDLYREFSKRRKQ